jgi:hypothetical protein
MKLHFQLWISLALACCYLPSHLLAQNLRSGNGQLTVATGVVLVPRGVTYRTSQEVEETKPAQLWIKVKKPGGRYSLRAYAIGYDSVQQHGAALVASAQLTTENGSLFAFTDTYTVTDDQGDFELSRIVRVVKSDPRDEGFNSRFTLGFKGQGSGDKQELFSPALWYLRNPLSPRIAANDAHVNEMAYYREMRTGLPFITMRSPNDGTVISLFHVAPAISSSVNERSREWLVDGSIQYGALGVTREANTEIGFAYPGIEDGAQEVSNAKSTIYRSHPVHVGFEQRYTLLIRISHASAFASALRGEWRYFYGVVRPEPASVPLDLVYSAGIHVLDHYAKNYGDAPGWPFVVDVPSGEITPQGRGKSLPISYQMGYVGQQLPNAYQLIRYGLLHNDVALLHKGKDIVSFWADRSPLPSGLPQVWYNVDPPTFRNGAFIYLRQVSDGMEGALAAAVLMRQHGLPQTNWERFCTNFGNWLVRSQNADGSFYRAYNADGTAAQKSTLNTTHVIRFLVRLYGVTKDRRYLQAALRAGRFSIANITAPELYVGGTVDDPDPVEDKEAGVEALHAYLALYDVTRDRRWLNAATNAADYVETWNLSWQYPIVTDEPAYRRAGTRGESFIKIGISGVDIFLSFEACDYYRLFLFTGDEQYRDFARLILTDTKLTTDWDGSLGYGQLGLLREASNLADIQASPRVGWLPWLTDAELAPLSELEDIFGSMSIDQIEKLPIDVRRRKNQSYLATSRLQHWLK